MFCVPRASTEEELRISICEFEYTHEHTAIDAYVFFFYTRCQFIIAASKNDSFLTTTGRTDLP